MGEKGSPQFEYRPDIEGQRPGNLHRAVHQLQPMPPRPQSQPRPAHTPRPTSVHRRRLVCPGSVEGHSLDQPGVRFFQIGQHSVIHFVPQ